MEKTVYYHDTDAGGVVYYANYLKYFEEGRTEFFQKKNISIKELHNKGFLYAVRKCTISYLAPARYGDILSIETSVNKITAAQIFFDQKVVHKESKQTMVEAEIILVSLNEEFKAAVVPDHIRTVLLP